MFSKSILRRNDLVYPELSYQIVGILFSIGKEVSFGHKENFYQKALSNTFKDLGVHFKEQVPFRIDYRDKPIGIYYFDFLIEDKVILEVKSRSYFSKKDIEQVYRYLRASKLKLGIIAHFTRSGVKFKRVVNL